MFEHLIVVVLLACAITLFLITWKLITTTKSLLEAKISYSVRITLELAGYNLVWLYTFKRRVSIEKIDEVLSSTKNPNEYQKPHYKEDFEGLEELEELEENEYLGADFRNQQIKLSVRERIAVKAEMYHLGFIKEDKKISEDALKLLYKLQQSYRDLVLPKV